MVELFAVAVLVVLESPIWTAALQETVFWMALKDRERQYMNYLDWSKENSVL